MKKKYVLEVIIGLLIIMFIYFVPHQFQGAIWWHILHPTGQLETDSFRIKIPLFYNVAGPREDHKNIFIFYGFDSSIYTMIRPIEASDDVYQKYSPSEKPIIGKNYQFISKNELVIFNRKAIGAILFDQTKKSYIEKIFIENATELIELHYTNDKQKQILYSDFLEK